MDDRARKIQYATHNDLDDLRRELKSELSDFRAEFRTFGRDIAGQLNNVGKTDWTVIISAVAVVLVLAGMAAALVSFSQEAETQARLTGDEVNKRIDDLNFSRDQELRTIEQLWDRKLEGAEKLISEQRAQLDKESRESINRILAERTDKLVEQYRDLKTRTEAEFVKIDVVLQREMRLLDEVLQREMGLHVARLEDLIEVNRKAIEEPQKRRRVMKRITRYNKAIGATAGGGIGLSLALLITWALETFLDHKVSGEVQSALAVVLAWVVSIIGAYMAPRNDYEDDNQNEAHTL